jgi:hypothetical protein
MDEKQAERWPYIIPLLYTAKSNMKINKFPERNFEA